eukprot:scaffold32948_cov131-Isochrysis_galbana.AAC.1
MLIVAKEKEVCVMSKANQRSIDAANKATGQDRTGQLVRVLQALARANKRSSGNAIHVNITDGDGDGDRAEDACSSFSRSESESGSANEGGTRKPMKKKKKSPIKKTTPPPPALPAPTGRRKQARPMVLEWVGVCMGTVRA